MEQTVPKRRHIQFRRWGITKKKEYNVLNVKNPRCGELSAATDLDIIFLPCITVARAACDSATGLPVFALLLHRCFARLLINIINSVLIINIVIIKSNEELATIFSFKTL
jgi:hypothetical protein